MAIENLQKSEGITAHKSTLLNSHVSTSNDPGFHLTSSSNLLFWSTWSFIYCIPHGPIFTEIDHEPSAMLADDTKLHGS